MKYFKYLLEKETSEIVVILLLFLSIVITPPPIVSAFLFTLIFFLACFTKRIGHFMGAMVAAEAEKNIPARSDYFLNVVTG